MGKDLFTAKQFIDAIPGSGGIIATIAKRVGCNWHTAQKYCRTFPTVRAVYDDECNAIDDLAVSTVLKSIQEGDVSTAKWWLAKKRKQEFGDVIDLTSGGERIVVKLEFGNGNNG